MLIIIILIIGCAQTRPKEDKAYEINPKQVVNNITVISDKSMQMLIELSREDLEKAIQLLNRHGGIVLHMGAWGIKVEGIKASRTMSSEAKQDTAIKATLP
jgi:hypothetical protein